MSDAELYFKLGFYHIADWFSYDHLLFLLTLGAVYTFSSLRPLLLVITGFTIGHTLTLSLSAFNWIHLPEKLVEILIPLTIIFAAAFNLRQEYFTTGGNAITGRFPLSRLWITLLFGCIHGLGFGGDFRALTEGFSESFIAPLAWFTAGIEIGQLTVIAALLVSGWLCTRLVPARYWITGLSVVAIVLSTWLLWSRL